MTERVPLPDLQQLNPDELRALIISQHEMLAFRDSEIEHLKLLISKLRREQYGRSSEKLDRQIEQLELRLGELEASRANDSERSESRRDSVVARPVRRPLPANLPRSSLFAKRHRPSPSHHSILIKSPRRPRNTNT